ncbi:MAG: hypothetical protein ACTSR8_13645 [Promethearchaeota archaeon]
MLSEIIKIEKVFKQLTCKEEIDPVELRIVTAISYASVMLNEKVKKFF